MDKYNYIFNCIYTLTNIGIFYYQNHELKAIKKGIDYNPIQDSPGFCEMLIEFADNQDMPVVYQDSFQVLYICIKEEMYYLFGPISLSNMNKIELHNYYQAYGINGQRERKLPLLLFSKEELIQGNHMAEQLEKNIEQEQILFQIREEEAPTSIFFEMSEVCDTILAGTADNIPFDFMGKKAYIAKKSNEQFQRADGKFANLIYNPERIK